MEFVLGVRKSEILYTLQQHCIEKGRRVYNNYIVYAVKCTVLDVDDYDDDSKGRRWRHRCLCRFKSISRTPLTCVVRGEQKRERGTGGRGRYTQKLFAFTTRREYEYIYPLSRHSPRERAPPTTVFPLYIICVCALIQHKIASQALMCEYTHCCCCRVRVCIWRGCRDTQKVGRSTNLRRTSKTVMDLSRARIRSNTHARSRIGRPYPITYI